MLRERNGFPWRRVLAVLGVILIVLAAFSLVRMKPPERSKSITISTATWEPYISPTSTNEGPLADIITRILRRIGYEPEFRFSSWPVAEQEVTSGESLAMGPVINTERRSTFGVHSDAIMEFRYGMFGKHGVTPDDIGSRDSLEGLKIARIDGYQFWPELDDSKAEFVDYPSALAAFEALAKGEVELVIEGELTGQQIIEGPELAEDSSDFFLDEAANKFSSPSLGLVLFASNSNGSTDFIDEFNDALRKYRSTESYSRITNSIGSDLQHVQLKSIGGGVIELFGEDGKKLGVAPDGTAGQVIRWPKLARTGEDLVTLKLFNGPHAGRVVKVPMKNMELTND